MYELGSEDTSVTRLRGTMGPSGPALGPVVVLSMPETVCKGSSPTSSAMNIGASSTTSMEIDFSRGFAKLNAQTNRTSAVFGNSLFPIRVRGLLLQLGVVREI
ncbi:MAG: hypothetical protein QXQ81_05830, partial [Candidatus Thorarchaeota archaeon]